MIAALLSEFLPYIIAFTGFVASIVTAFLAGKRGGKKDVENDMLKDKQKRESAARDKVREGRSSGLSPDERVRRNDGDWRGM
jgi:hypothetical protein